MSYTQGQAVTLWLGRESATKPLKPIPATYLGTTKTGKHRIAISRMHGGVIRHEKRYLSDLRSVSIRQEELPL